MTEDRGRMTEDRKRKNAPAKSRLWIFIPLLAALPLYGANFPSALAADNNTSPLGMNVCPFDYWSRAIPFKNVFRQCMGWRQIDATGDHGADRSLFDADGWPLSLPQGARFTAGMLQGAGGHYPNGQYVCLFEGEGTLGFGWDARNSQVDPLNPNRYTFDVPTPTNDGIWLLINSMTKPIRNIRIMPIEFEANEVDNPWHPLFLERLSKFNTIRFMPWSLGNESSTVVADGHSPNSITGGTNTIVLQSDINMQNGPLLILSDHHYDRRMIESYDPTTKIATVSVPWSGTDTTLPKSWYTIRKYGDVLWSDRKRGTELNQQGAVSVEVMVDLANRLNASPWFSIPAAASDDYIRQFATYVRDHLKSNLRTYIEYSNETWNSGAPGYNYCVAKGAELGIDGQRYHAYRAVQMFKIWDDVFGEQHLQKDRPQSRLIRLLASQNASTSNSVAIMDFNGTGLRTGAPNPFDPALPTGYHKAADYADALTITFYMGEAITANVVKTKTYDELIDLLEYEVEAQMSTGGSRFTNIQNAQARGLDTVIYEGGTSVCTNVDGSYRYLKGNIKSASADTFDILYYANLTNDYYKNWVISITDGSGKGQTRTIMSNSATLVRDTTALVHASIDTPWETIPDSTSRFVIQLSDHYKEDQLNRHPRMKELYLKALNAWKKMGLDANGKGCKLLNLFNDVHEWNYWGRWGHLEYFDQDPKTTPRWVGMEEFMNQGPLWWSDPLNPIQGNTLELLYDKGTVVKNPDKTVFSPGETVTLTAIPDPGYTFLGWSGNASGTEPTTTLVMDASKSVTAKFTYTISVTAGAGGFLNPGKSISVAKGASQTFTMTPFKFYHRANVLIDGLADPGAMSTGSYTFADIASDHAIEAQFAVDQNLPNGLLAYFPFENNAMDQSASNIPTTVNGNPAYVPGRTNDAISLNGSSETVLLGGNLAIPFTEFSVSLWLKAPPRACGQQVIGRGDWTKTDGWAMYLFDRGTVFFGRPSTPAVINTSITDNQWHHIVGTATLENGTIKLRIYLDGSLFATTGTGRTNFAEASTDPLHDITTIGSANGSGYFLDGVLDEVRIYNTALSAQDVQALYLNNQKSVLGDVSGDGEVTAYDAALVAQASVNSITLTADQTKAAEVSGDGEVTGYDAALIAQRAVGLINKFPVET